MNLKRRNPTINPKIGERSSPKATVFKPLHCRELTPALTTMALKPGALRIRRNAKRNAKATFFELAGAGVLKNITGSGANFNHYLIDLQVSGIAHKLRYHLTIQKMLA